MQYRTIKEIRNWYYKPVHGVSLINGMELQKEALNFLKANDFKVDVYDFCNFLGIELDMIK